MSRNSYIKSSKQKILASADEVMKFIGKDNCTMIIDGRASALKITNFRSIYLADQHDMTFCSVEGDQGLRLVDNCKATIIICPLSLRKRIKAKERCALILVKNPRLWFIRCIAAFGNALLPNEREGLHSTSIVESENLGKGVHVGPYCYIAKDVVIGDNAVIHGGVYIHGRTTIGKNVTINSNSVIGEDGFGFEKNDEGEWEKFHHLGGVEIHDNVEIGANTCIDRGTLENTVIGSGTKIDNLVHIAHNVKVGKNCIIVAQSLIAGSSILEDGAYVAMCACIREGVRLGENSFVGMGAVVTKDVMKGDTVIGVPARSKIPSRINDI